PATTLIFHLTLFSTRIPSLLTNLYRYPIPISFTPARFHLLYVKQNPALSLPKIPFTTSLSFIPPCNPHELLNLS
ncbi:hypothetical protein, partial [Paenibacillus xylanexedens]|uniref:hypothetical protein n=1 Tax=Paenibacillus xylanexedens TaxID=528191 RepID=UPI001C930B91